MRSPISGDADQIRWLPVRNTGGSGTVPAFGLMRITGFNSEDGVYTVGQPNASNLGGLLVNGPAEIEADNDGVGTPDPVAIVLYDTGDGTPTNGQQWGSASGSWKLRSGKTGWKIAGAASEGSVIAYRDEGASASASGTNSIGILRQTGDDVRHPLKLQHGYTVGTWDTGAGNGGTIVAVPFMIGEPCTIDRLGIYPSSLGMNGTKVRVGIYDSVSSTQISPNNLLVDSGEITAACTASLGINEATVSLDLTETNVIYWAVLRTDSDALSDQVSVSGFSPSDPEIDHPTPMGFRVVPVAVPETGLAVYPEAGGRLGWCKRGMGALAALPSTFPADAYAIDAQNVSDGNIYVNAAPILWARFA